jgi:hypothetical protein
VHPLQFGIARRRLRAQRRAGLPRENPLLFHAREAWRTLRGAVAWGRLFLRYQRMMGRVVADPAAKQYRDAALTPVEREAADASELMRTHAAKIPHTHGAPQPQRALAG